jgi:MFS family permease
MAAVMVILAGLVFGPTFPTIIGVLMGHVNESISPVLGGRAVGLFFAIGGIGWSVIPILIGAYARKTSVQRSFVIAVVAAVGLTVAALALHFVPGSAGGSNQGLDGMPAIQARRASEENSQTAVYPLDMTRNARPRLYLNQRPASCPSLARRASVGTRNIKTCASGSYEFAASMSQAYDQAATPAHFELLAATERQKAATNAALQGPGGSSYWSDSSNSRHH